MEQYISYRPYTDIYHIRPEGTHEQSECDKGT